MSEREALERARALWGDARRTAAPGTADRFEWLAEMDRALAPGGGEPVKHPRYGPCDAFGPDGACSVCRDDQVPGALQAPSKEGAGVKPEALGTNPAPGDARVGEGPVHSDCGRAHHLLDDCPPPVGAGEGAVGLLREAMRALRHSPACSERYPDGCICGVEALYAGIDAFLARAGALEPREGAG